MRANSDKSHLLLSTLTSSTAKINGDIKNSELEKLLKVTIDYKLKFEEHLLKKCDKASQKFNALARISTYKAAATWGPGGHGPQLQFLNQTRSKNFSFKHQGYCFLQMFRNYTDQKYHNFCRACYNFWTIYGVFSFFPTT